MAMENIVGKRICAYREKLGMDIEELSSKSGVPEIMIAAIESGEVTAAMGPMTRIAGALGVRLGTFMDDQFVPDPVICRKDYLAANMRTDGIVGSFGFAFKSVAHGKPDRHMEPFRIVLPPDAVSKTVSLEGEVFVVVFEGEVKFVYGGEEFVLQAGDTAFFNCVVRSTCQALGGKPAVIYGAIYQPV